MLLVEWSLLERCVKCTYATMWYSGVRVRSHMALGIRRLVFLRTPSYKRHHSVEHKKKSFTIALFNVVDIFMN